MSFILWAGSEESYEVLAQAREQVKILAQQIQAAGGDMPDMPENWRREGSVGVIPVNGSLTDGHAGWMSLFGVTGYADIEDGITGALRDPEVKSLLLAVNSPGGAATGELQALSDYILRARTAKPVHAVGGNMMASAAYWLAAPAETITLDPLGIAGSIGCVAIHTSLARAMQANGVDKTVIRSGKYKMLGHPSEPLSDLARAEMQDKVDHLAGIFERHVARMRGVPVDDVREKMGQGRTFIGQKALDAGLVDKLGTFDQAVAAAKKR